MCFTKAAFDFVPKVDVPKKTLLPAQPKSAKIDRMKIIKLFPNEVSMYLEGSFARFLISHLVSDISSKKVSLKCCRFSAYFLSNTEFRIAYC